MLDLVPDFRDILTACPCGNVTEIDASAGGFDDAADISEVFVGTSELEILEFADDDIFGRGVHGAGINCHRDSASACKSRPVEVVVFGDHEINFESGRGVDDIELGMPGRGVACGVRTRVEIGLRKCLCQPCGLIGRGADAMSTSLVKRGSP